MRGKVSTHDVEEQLFRIRERNPDSFVPWIPNNMQLAVCDVPPTGMELSGTLIGNTTAMMDLFKRVNGQFLQMMRKRAFLHLFTNEGVEEGEFNEAESNLVDLIAEYQQYFDTPVGADDEYGNVNETPMGGSVEVEDIRPVNELPDTMEVC